MSPYQDGLPVGEEGEHMWFAGMITAAQDRGMEVQLCMASRELPKTIPLKSSIRL